MNNLVVTILTEKHDELHFLNEKPILAQVIEYVRELQPKKIIIVTGKFYQTVIQTLSNYIDIFGLIFLKQPEPLGSGDAIKWCLDEYDNLDKVLILNGDNSFITNSLIQGFINGSRGSCNILTKNMENPNGYGRIIFDKDGDFIDIIEDNQCSSSQRAISIVTIGVFYIDGFVLKQFVPFISNNNLQKEYYLTDIVRTVKNKSWNVVDSVLLDDIIMNE